MSKAPRKAKGKTPAKPPATSDTRARPRGSNQRLHPEPLPQPTPEVLAGEVVPFEPVEELVAAVVADLPDDPDWEPTDKVDPRSYVPSTQDRTVVALGKACGMSSAQIAGLIGVSRATLYKHFPEDLAIGHHKVTTKIAGNVARIAQQNADPKAAISAAKLWMENIAGINKGGQGGDKQASALAKAAQPVASAEVGIISPQGLLKVRVNIGTPPGLLADV